MMCCVLQCHTFVYGYGMHMSVSCCHNFVVSYFRDAEDAVHARDGYDYDGYRLRVEFPRGGGPGGFRGRGRGRGPPARRSQYRVLVTGNISLFTNNNQPLLHCTIF